MLGYRLPFVVTSQNSFNLLQLLYAFYQVRMLLLKVPVRHRINVRTTNLLERSFVEERRRTKVIPRFTNEKSAMKLVFATLIRVSERWSRVSFSELDRQWLKLLRRELGIGSPAPDEKREVRREGSEVA